MDKKEYTTLAEALEGVPDPRRRRGVRHSWGLVLTLIGAAMLAGQKHTRAIGQWVGEHTQTLVDGLEPACGRLPSEATLRRALLAVDVGELEARLKGFTARLDEEVPASAGSRAVGEPQLRGQALDGKQVRGAGVHAKKVHLLSAMRHESGIVLAQVEVGTKTNEIGAAPALLAQLELANTVTTVDALLAQRSLARQILDGGGHYLMVIKRNQPETFDAIAQLFADPPWLPHERELEYWIYTNSVKGHGRYETRVLEASISLNEWLNWPGVRQVMRRHCTRVMVGTGEMEEETWWIVLLHRGHEP